MTSANPRTPRGPRRASLKCPGYLDLLGHFARKVIECDQLRAQLDEMKAKQRAWLKKHDDLLRIVGREVGDDPEMYFEAGGLDAQHGSVVTSIRLLRESIRVLQNQEPTA